MTLELGLDDGDVNKTDWVLTQYFIHGSRSVTPTATPFRIGREINGVDHFWTATDNPTPQQVLLQPLALNENFNPVFRNVRLYAMKKTLCVIMCCPDLDSHPFPRWPV